MLYTFSYIKYGRTMGEVQHVVVVVIYVYIYIYIWAQFVRDTIYLCRVDMDDRVSTPTLSIECFVSSYL